MGDRARYPFKLRGRPLVTTSIVVAIPVLTLNVSTFFVQLSCGFFVFLQVNSNNGYYMAKQPKQPKEIKLEDILFKCRDALRGRAPMTDKRDLLLTLVFLKFVGDRFEERHEQILKQYADEPDFAKIAAEKDSFYKQEGIFFLPEEC